MSQASEDQRAKSHFMRAVRRMIKYDRFREFPGEAYALRYLTEARLVIMPVISATTRKLILESCEILADRVLKFFDPDTLYAISAYLENLAVFIVAQTAESPEGIYYGIANRYRESSYIVVARQRHRQDLPKFNIASAIFHELIHVATWGDLKLDHDEYLDVYEHYHQTSGLDSFTDTGRTNRTERTVRAFQGALFGALRQIDDLDELERGTLEWQQRYPLLLQLVLRDYHKVFSQARFLKAEVIEMSASDTVRMVPEELARKRGTTCMQMEGLIDYDPVYRGTLMWLREQSIQAERDPSREWLGFRHEFELLLAGNHSDPHPERIILGKDVEDFDPRSLRYPDMEIELSDNSGFWGVGDASSEREFGHPVGSQQLLAAICRQKLNYFLGIDESEKYSRERRARYGRSPIVSAIEGGTQ